MTTSYQPPGALLSFSDADRSPLSIRAKALVFVDPRSKRLHDELEELAPCGLAVLIHGETGSGKELVARQIHRSSRRHGLFVAVNCGALLSDHADAELFGYAAGQPLQGCASRTGWYGSANGGTLYLDEIGDLPLNLQSKLLTALQTREIQRVGARTPTPVDVRLVAATSIDLTKAVSAGTFNALLFEYLNEGYLELPPLRKRLADILPLAEYFLAMYAQRLNLAVPAFSDTARLVLEQHRWPGNTRELENIIHFALLVCRNGSIEAQDLNLPQD
ncbi:MAG: sigma-54-dependent Fis family transcriptional regulator [Pseudomonas sp.]|nr:sigma-54-dependent Fis family transcriptional regulator [Pseudomonas sp.]MBQ0778132.1 sigma-54-dependent Fis family transcriptional regulator [Pseudomonas sp.]